jgi:hypothetical protein
MDVSLRSINKIKNENSRIIRNRAASFKNQNRQTQTNQRTTQRLSFIKDSPTNSSKRRQEDAQLIRQQSMFIPLPSKQIAPKLR